MHLKPRWMPPFLSLPSLFFGCVSMSTSSLKSSNFWDKHGVRTDIIISCLLEIIWKCFLAGSLSIFLPWRATTQPLLRPLFPGCSPPSPLRTWHEVLPLPRPLLPLPRPAGKWVKTNSTEQHRYLPWHVAYLAFWGATTPATATLHILIGSQTSLITSTWNDWFLLPTSKVERTFISQIWGNGHAPNHTTWSLIQICSSWEPAMEASLTVEWKKVWGLTVGEDMIKTALKPLDSNMFTKKQALCERL